MESTTAVAQIDDDSTQALAYDDDLDDFSDIPPLVEHSEIDNWNKRQLGDSDEQDSDDDYPEDSEGDSDGSRANANERCSVLKAKRQRRAPTCEQLIQAIWSETFCGEHSIFRKDESAAYIIGTAHASGGNNYTTVHTASELDTKILDVAPQTSSKLEIPFPAEEQSKRGSVATFPVAHKK